MSAVRSARAPGPGWRRPRLRWRPATRDWQRRRPGQLRGGLGVDVLRDRVYYSASTLLCVPNALSQPGGYALGAQAGEAAIRQVVTDAGFTRFRRATETPFNLVYEVRP
jgi:hypothetical protein